MTAQVFVARERELAQLQGFLAPALAGRGQVCFVVGEAGSGKTTLVTEFARRAQEAQADLLVAIGSCNAQTGIGDPYLPFREILGMLTGDVEGQLAQGFTTATNADRLRAFVGYAGQTLVKFAPDLINVFVPGTKLLVEVGTFVAEKVGWTDRLEQLTKRPPPAPGDLKQGQIFEQYTRVLQNMAQKKDLLLVLDDLQWADAASLSLLFHLGRHIGESRILIVGLYRPEEVALGRGGERHPLEKVLAEFKRYYGDLDVDLDQAEEAEGRQFVAAWLDTEPNRLGAAFREALFHHTGGHPLFTVELLRDLQERGDIVRDEEGRWVEGPGLDWGTLPARVEGVIEERIGRLEEELREILAVASVEGENFTARVIARVQEVRERQLLRQLSQELERRHRLVRERGEVQVGRQFLSRYQFAHALFQQYLYNELGAGERRLLHGEVAAVLEELYQGRTDEVCVQLARHYAEAGVVEKAADYLLQAGDQARRLDAPQEAIDHYRQALDLLPEDVEHAARWVALCERLGDTLVRQAHWTEVGEAYTAMRVAAEAAADKAAQARAWIGLFWMHDAQSRFHAALESVVRAAEIAQAAGDARFELANALRDQGWCFCRLGDAERGLALAEQALALHTELGTRGRDMVLSLMTVSFAHENLGHDEQAVHHYEEALASAREAGDRASISDMLNILGATAGRRGDYGIAVEYGQEALAITRELGNRGDEAWALRNLGLTWMRLEEHEQAARCYEQILAIGRETGARREAAPALNSLGELARRQGHYERAQSFYEESLELYREMDHRIAVAMVLSNLGYIALHQGDKQQAAVLFEESLALYRELERQAGIALCLAGLAGVAGAEGQPERAARLFGAAEALLEAANFHLAITDQADWDRNVAAVRAQLDEAAFAAAWAEGRAMAVGDWEQAIAYALEEALK